MFACILRIKFNKISYALRGFASPPVATSQMWTISLEKKHFHIRAFAFSHHTRVTLPLSFYLVQIIIILTAHQLQILTFIQHPPPRCMTTSCTQNAIKQTINRESANCFHFQKARATYFDDDDHLIAHASSVLGAPYTIRYLCLCSRLQKNKIDSIKQIVLGCRV